MTRIDKPWGILVRRQPAIRSFAAVAALAIGLAGADPALTVDAVLDGPPLAISAMHGGDTTDAAVQQERDVALLQPFFPRPGLPPLRPFRLDERAPLVPEPRPACGGPPMLRFSTPVAADSETVIAAVGDVLLHARLQRQAFAHPDGFASLWSTVEPLLLAADIAYANLEGPIADGVTKIGTTLNRPVDHYDDWVFSSYPLFNYPPTLAAALADSGFDVVSTANNHSLDRFAIGADRTIAAVTGAGLAFTGTRPSDRPGHPWYAITEAGRTRIAWLACSYSTNGVPDPHDQVLMCYEDTHEVLSQIHRLSRDPAIDAVILTPHWGREYTHRPDGHQQALAREALDAGAIAVIGSHPHVIQPWERYVTRDGREGFILYSLGNFVSGQRQLPRRTTIVLLLGLAETADGRVTVAGARYLPIRFSFSGGADGRTLTLETVGPGNDHGSLGLLSRLLHPGNAHALADRLTTIDACTPRVDAVAEAAGNGAGAGADAE